MRIVSVSSSRADVGPLSAVWTALCARGVELHIVLTGMHMAEGAPQPGPIPAGARVHRCGADLGGRADAPAAAALGEIAGGCERLYADIRPHVVLVLGDRLDMAPAALAASLFNIPVSHIHGGEITEGAIDDCIRHAVTIPVHCARQRSGGRRDECDAGGLGTRPGIHAPRRQFGLQLYPNALRQAMLMLGNSSSGVIEAGLFGVPVVDVGDRQMGRERGGNVAQMASDGTAVKQAVREAASRGRLVDCRYGDGRAGGRNADALPDHYAGRGPAGR